MTVLSLTGNELHLGPDGQIAVRTGRKAYAQTVTNAIRTVFGEVPSNTSLGIPYFDTVFMSHDKVLLWKAKVEKRIQEFEFVDAVSEFNATVDYETRVLTYSLVVTTDEGNVRISGTKTSESQPT